MSWRERTLLGAICGTCVLFLGAAPAFAGTIVVPAGGDALLHAVATAKPQETLLLAAGRHHGPVVIDKPLILEGAPGAVLEGNGQGSVIRIVAPGVTVRGLTIRGSGTDGAATDAGIYVEQQADHPTIVDNRLDGNLVGIVLHGPAGSVVRANRVTNRNDLWLNDRGNGIYIWNARGSSIEANAITGGRDGIFVNVAKDNTISGNYLAHLRFAIHYMYSYGGTISDNISIRNHAGFVLMYSNDLRVERNISFGDGEHGLMLNSTRRSEVAGNVIKNAEGDCGFVYLASANRIHRNRFEGCAIGLNFSGGSEKNEVWDNAFIGNGTQVKYSGLTFYEWSKGHRGNYWSDNSGFDLDGDGIADTAYRPNTLLDRVLWAYPLAKLLLSSPALEAVRFAQSQFPALAPGGVIDSRPLMTPPPAEPAILASAQEHAIPQAAATGLPRRPESN